LKVFGAYDVNTKKGFLITGPVRTRKTLIAIIKTRIGPGSIVLSGFRAAHRTIFYKLYVYLTVNHKYNFVDFRMYVTTNYVESF
jgi:hypothetical protein